MEPVSLNMQGRGQRAPGSLTEGHWIQTDIPVGLGWSREVRGVEKLSQPLGMSLGSWNVVVSW